MKLFLYSLNFTMAHCTALNDLVGKNPNEIRFALIENAADVDRDGPEGWVEGIRKTITEKGYQIKIVDLKQWYIKKDRLEKVFDDVDVIWVGGGNGYYLRWLMKLTGVDLIIKELIENGVVYSGWSAGACVAGPTLRFAETMDDPSQAPEIIYDGLKIIDKVVIPLIDNGMFGERALEWNNKLNKEGYETILLQDSQALIINGDEHKII